MNQFEELFSGKHLRLLRAHVGADDGPARLLKTALNDTAGSPGPLQLSHEYELLKDLEVAGILIPLAKLTVEGRPAIGFEDPGGATLSQLLDAGPMHLPLFLDVAIQLTHIIDRLHRKGIIHKDIHSGNVIVRTHCDPVAVYLTGLGIASLLPGQSVEKIAPDQLEGTLEVMSPEQTGRMNRPLDFRTDFYSLGGLFYLMLTGRLPFSYKTPLELVHAHMAKKPVAPSKLGSHIPVVLSELVLKLLAKDADDRYCSTAGIIADLNRCRDEWRRNDIIAPFRLGLKDVAETLNIPDKLYGRDAQMRKLAAAFERVCDGGPVETVLVEGRAGVGKTELIQQLRRLIAEKNGFLISGKCDLLDRKIPCAPFIEALSDGVSHALAAPGEDLMVFQKNLRLQLGRQGRVLTDVIPLLSHITGEQPPVPELPPDQARHRLHLMILRLFAAATMRGRTFLLFLDDLQWADYATLKMMEIMAKGRRLKHVLLIGAFRGQPNDPPPHLRHLINEIEAAGAPFQTIRLGPLPVEAINRLIADTFHASPAATQELAALCFQKTGGNPFFLKRFLLEMAKRRLILFDPDRRRWQWLADKIARTHVTENVVELMAHTIAGLDGNVQSAIKTSACIGNRFDLGTLSHVNAMRPEKLLRDLWPAVQSSLIALHQAPGLQTAMANGEQAVIPILPTGADAGQIRFAFIHDRVHEAAYGLMGPDQRMQMHLRIGRLMLETSAAELQDEKIFDILGQLNRAIPLITAPDEVVHLTELNLKAGQKARAMALLESAFDYFRTGIELTGAKGWQQQYERTRALYLGGIESAFVTGRHSELDQWFEAADEYISNPLEAVDVFAVRIEKETANWNFEGALDHALTLLGRLGVHLPIHPATAELLDVMEKVEKQLCALTDEALLNLPAMKNPKHLAVLNILFSTSHAAFFVNRELYILSILYGVSLLLRHGNNDLLPVFFSVYASILTLFPQTVANAPKYGRLSIRYLERIESPTIAINTKYYFINGVLPLVQPVEKSAEAMEDLYKASLEAGTLLLGGNCLFLHELVGFCMGKRLDDLNGQMSESRGLLKRMHHDSGVLLMDLHQQMVQNLMGQAEHGASLHGPVFDERVSLPAAEQTQNQTLLIAIYFCMMTLAYFFENNAKASGLAEKVVDSMYVPPMPHYMARCHLYAALARTAMCQMDDESPDDVIMAKVAVNEQWLQSFADQASMNYLHMLYLLKAERARVEGRILAAEDHYDKAITLAEENGYLQDQALANELAARFWMARGKKPIARLYMDQALEGYTRWGAAAKVRHLKEKHPEYFIKKGAVAAGDEAPERPSVDLDMMSALRASQAISGEIVLERLIEKLMGVVIENAGATSGRLLLKSKGGLYVVGEADADQYGKVLPPGKAVVVEKASHLVPMQVIQYVGRTGKALVMEHAATHEPFARDPYILKNTPRSLLCSPIVRNEKVIGLFYLENNLAAGAFTAERLKMLEILSAQIAVSLENAKLYTERSKILSALETEHAQLLSIFDSMDEVIYIADPNNYDLLYGNEVFRKVWGNPVGKKCYQALQGRDDPCPFCTNDMIFGDNLGKTHIWEVQNEMNGRWYRCIDRAIKWTNGSMVRFEMAIDNHDLKMAQIELDEYRDHLEKLVEERTHQLAAAKEQAEAANQSKSAFLANMSHEIRTPMNAVIGFTDIMRKTELTEQQQEYLQAVKQGGRTLLTLIDDILDFSKIEAGKMGLEVMDFDPERAIYDVCNLISPRLGDKSIELLCRIDAQVPAAVSGDEGKFKQVLLNLLGNAVKFTKAGEIEISLKSAPGENGGIKLYTQVRDTGIGIAEDQLGHIFNAFEQADGTITRRFGGTGLGLAISKKIAVLMDGDLWAESTVGQGSRFHFTAWMKPGQGGMADTEMDSYGLEDKKVLIVDDNAANLIILQQYLKQFKMQVTAIGNPEEVLPLLHKAVEQKTPYDICMLDIQMPLLSGYEVAKGIRGAAAEPVTNIPLLALSSLVKGDAERYQRAGFDGVIAKPIMRHQLYLKVQQLLDIERCSKPVPAADVQKPAGEASQQSARILIAEDNEINMMLTEHILTDSGYVVHKAENGQLAFDAYTRGPDAYDLILMDVQMPVMDGLKASEMIRQWEADNSAADNARRVPILAMTAGALKGDREKCMQAGMDDYVSKPINIDEVLKVVSVLIAGG